MKLLHISLIAIISISSNVDAQNSAHQLFAQGVASGDPDASSVVLWTRAVVNTGTILNWELSDDTLFNKVFRQGTALVDQRNNFCVKVIANNLKPGTTYYYRFLTTDKKISDVGRTKTLPLKTDAVKLAFVNCSKYEGGYFNGFNALTKSQFEDIDAVIHLGDYIYESVLDTINTPPNHGYMRAYELTGRLHHPAKEVITLADYRQRFQQYRDDPDLQELHRLFPMINIWDDHEFANDAWADSSKSHTDKQVSWSNRVANAKQAYFEWIPIRGKSDEPIYRSFKFGNLLNLLMLDTRICCRSAQSASVKNLESDFEKSTLVGANQLAWMSKTLESNTAWTAFGNQVLFSQYYQEDDKLKFNLDDWNGYPRERGLFKNMLTNKKGNRPLIFTGNNHDARFLNITTNENDIKSDTIAYEIQPGSISSGNFGEKGDISAYYTLLKKVKENNPLMNWVDLTFHGFVVASFTTHQVTVDWYKTSTIWSNNYKLKKIFSWSSQSLHELPSIFR